MGTKNNPGNFDCYSNALPDEPMFILLARDASASNLVRQWASARHDKIRLGEAPSSDARMVDEALSCAEAMDAWRKANDGAWRRST